jgi:heparan-alpha-glucosaminide N-acetyltransferase
MDAKDPTPPPYAPPKPERLLSLDTYRGFLMLVLATSAFQIHKLAGSVKEGPVWNFLSYQFSHPEWRSCSFWDLVQPSFMFMVGVAVPYSVASRRAKGDSGKQVVVHALWRSLILILLGVFCSSNGAKQTDWTFVNVLSQIGLGYTFLVLLEGRGLRVQMATLASILVGYWLCFVLYPAPAADTNWTAIGVKSDVYRFGGFAAHWSMNANFGQAFDRWFLNLFPPHNFKYNAGGYSTLNFIPSTATMLIGVMAGELLRGPRLPMDKLKLMLASGAACFAFSILCDPQILPFIHDAYVVCPIVKKIWTPSWALFCSGWTLWILSGFYYLVDITGHKKWTFPFVVVGVNCTAMYLMWQMFKGWVNQSIRTHFGNSLFETAYGPIWASLAWTLVLWLICLWMYRRKIFLKV